MWVCSGRATNSKPTVLEQQLKFRGNTWKYNTHATKKCSSLGQVFIYDGGNERNRMYVYVGVLWFVLLSWGFLFGWGVCGFALVMVWVFLSNEKSYPRGWKSLSPWSVNSKFQEWQMWPKGFLDSPLWFSPAHGVCKLGLWESMEIPHAEDGWKLSVRLPMTALASDSLSRGKLVPTSPNKC